MFCTAACTWFAGRSRTLRRLVCRRSGAVKCDCVRRNHVHAGLVWHGAVSMHSACGQSLVDDTSVPQAKLANSNEVLERSILRTQQHEALAEHEQDSVPGNDDGRPCPGGCGRVVWCATTALWKCCVALDTDGHQAIRWPTAMINAVV